jgi:hypothetical protein
MLPYLCNLCNFSSTLKSNYNRHLKTQKHKNALINSQFVVMIPNDTKMIPNDTKMIPNDTKMIPNDTKIKKNNLLNNKIINQLENKEIKCKKNKKKTLPKKHLQTNKDFYVKCEYCQKKFKNVRSLYRHKNELRCKKMPHDEKSQIIQYCNNKTIQKIKSDNPILNINQGTINNTINNTVNNNINQTINNTFEVKINPVGKEDTSFLTKQDKLRILGRIYNSIPELIKTIHDNPVNRNFFLPNTNKNIVACLNNSNQIEYNDYNQMCQKILQDNVDRLDELFNELETDVNESIKCRLGSVLQKVEKGELDKKYLKDIKLYIFNASKRNKEDITNYIDNIEQNMNHMDYSDSVAVQNTDLIC